MQPGVTYADNFATTFNLRGGTVNTAGETAFAATVIGPGINSGNNRVAWVGAPGNFRLLARSGEQAPRTPAGTIFTGLSVAGLNAVGQAVVSGALSGAGVGRENDKGW